MQPNKLATVPVTVEDTWNQARSSEALQAFVGGRLANPVLSEIELAVE